MVRLIIPEELDKKYNYALQELPKGQNTLVGNRDKKEMLEVAMLNPETPNGLIIGGKG